MSGRLSSRVMYASCFEVSSSSVPVDQ